MAGDPNRSQLMLSPRGHPPMLFAAFPSSSTTFSRSRISSKVSSDQTHTGSVRGQFPFNGCGTSLNCSEVVRITSPIWPTSRFTVRPWHRTDTIICICSAGRSGRRRRRRRSMANTTWPRWFISPSTTEDASGTLVGLRWLSVNAALALGWGRTRTDVPTGCEENTQ